MVFRAERNNSDVRGNGEQCGRSSTGTEETDSSSTRPQEKADFHKIIWEEYFVLASSLGVSYSDFLKMTPKKLWAVVEGKNLKDNEWIQIYGLR